MMKKALVSAALLSALLAAAEPSQALADNDDRQSRSLAGQRESIDDSEYGYGYRYDRDYGADYSFESDWYRDDEGAGYGRQDNLDVVLGTALAIGVVGALLDDGRGGSAGGTLTALSQALVQGYGYNTAGYSSGGGFGARPAWDDPRAAVEACEQRGEQIVRQRGGRDFDITQVTDLDRDYRGGFEIEGNSTSFYRYRREQGRVTCSVRNGQVTSLRVR